MKIEIKYPRAKPYFSKKMKDGILKDISGILDSGMLTQGAYVAEFESRFKKEIGTDHAIATSSCTSALEIAIKALKLKNTNILVTTSFHIINSRSMRIIEDCAHAHGATINNMKAGSLGDVGCFSFYPTKIMATGEGGMITTNNSEIAEQADIYRNHGTTRNPQKVPGLDYGVTCHMPSQNYRMTEIAGILGLYQLEQLSNFVESRRRVSDLYRKYLKNIPGVNLLPKHKGHSYWNFFIILDKNINREEFAKILLHENGIQTANAYSPAIHEQEMFKQYVTTLPIADDILSRHISLPMYVTLQEKDIHHITNCIKDACIRSK